MTMEKKEPQAAVDKATGSMEKPQMVESVVSATYGAVLEMRVY